MALSGASSPASDYPALLAWFNHLPLFSQSDDFTKDDLSDGNRIWQTLHDVNPAYFRGALPEGAASSRRRNSHIGNLQNVKRIYKTVRQYLVDDRGVALPPGFNNCDLNLVSEGASEADLALLIRTILYIAVLYPSDDVGNEPYLLAISKLSSEHQGTLARVINDLQEAEDSSQAALQDEGSRTGSPVQSEASLRDDEQAFRLRSENKELEREKLALKRELGLQEERLARLSQNNNILQEQLASAQASLENATESVDQGYRIRDLEAKHKSQDDYIADLEERFQGAQDKQTGLQTEINKLRKASEKLQPLQDEVDELKAAKDSLSRRNNVLERYKNKLQSVQEIENENRALRRELEEARYLSQEGDGSQLNNSALQREVMELKTLMSNTEIQLVEATNRRRQIEFDNEELLKRLEEAAAQRERDQELVVRMRESSPGLADTSDGQLMDLDAELESSQRTTNDKTEQQKKQERLYRVGNQDAARRIALEEALENAKKSKAGLQRRNLDLTGKNITLEGIMREPEAEEHQKAYLEVQEKLDNAEKELESLRRERDDFQAQVSDAEKTIAGYDQEKVEAVEAIKELNSQECIGLRAKIFSNEEVNADLRLQLEEHRAMLIESLKQSPAPLARTEAAQEQQDEDSSNTEEATAAAERMRELLEDVQATKDREQTLREDLEQRDLTIEKLRGELRANAEKVAPTLLRASEQASLKLENENLRRENKLIATAYYDLGSRIQMNNVSLQRRQDAPKSFLNRQRLLVSQAATVRAK